jgi:glycosyltransferase involved in cell wall biosynthesis
LKEMAGSSVRFVGYVPDDELPDLMAKCRAFLFPGLEDFGITPVQAQAAGRPVIAFKGGGALDTVIPGETGEFFEEQTVESLAAVLRTFDPSRYDPDAMRRHALKFDSTVFREQIIAGVEQGGRAGTRPNTD